MRPMRSNGKREILRPLTGLRGITILSVIMMHYHYRISTLFPSLGPILNASDKIAFRMDLYFILSGFILSYIYLRRDEPLTGKVYGRFLWARFIRNYPGHLATLLALVVGVILAKNLDLPMTGTYSLPALPCHLTLTQAWPLLSWAIPWWNYPTWFLSALFFAYVVVFPCAWKVAQRVRGSGAAMVLAFGSIAAWLILSRLVTLEGLRLWIRVSCEFVCGTALFVLHANGSKLVLTAQRHLDKIVAVFALILLFDPLAPAIANPILILGLPFLLGGLTAETSFTARFLASRPMLWLGKLSYALFVSHALAQKALRALLPAAHFASSPFLVRLLLLALTGAAVLGAALALHHLVELPCARALKNRRPAAILSFLGRRFQAGAAQP